MATGFNPPHNVEHMFGGWLLGLNKILKSVFLLGAAVLCWALWTGRNDLVFEKKLYCSPLQVILSASHCLSRWAILQREGGSTYGCNRITNLGEGGHGVFLPEARVAI